MDDDATIGKRTCAGKARAQPLSHFERPAYPVPPYLDCGIPMWRITDRDVSQALAAGTGVIKRSANGCNRDASVYV